MRRLSAPATAATFAALALGVSACGASDEPAASGPPSPAGTQASLGTGAPEPGASQADAAQDGTSRTSSPASKTGAGADTDPVEAAKQFLAGKRQALIHIAEDNKDWSATYEGAIAIGGGTDDGARFRVIPSGKDKVMIEALRAREEGGRWCVHADSRDEPVSLGTVKCAANENTLFRITATGKSDAKGRPTYRILNDKYGTVQVRNDGSALYIQEVGDGGSRGTFSFVDRGTR